VPEYCAIVSTKPGSIRGGATGSRLKPMRPMTVATISVVRARGYAARCDRHIHTSTTGVTM